MASKSAMSPTSSAKPYQTAKSRSRRLSSRHQAIAQMSAAVAQERHAAHCRDHDHHEGSRSRHCLGSEEADKTAEGKDATISIASTSKQVGKTVAPFLSSHIPQQYNPFSTQPSPRKDIDGSNTKYCYRHRPDLLCRRQANEPSMAELQNELATLSLSDQQGISHVWSLFAAAPAKHRNLMLQGILAQCCFPQLSYISASIRDLIKIDFLSALPPELGLKILCYLDTVSLSKAAQVSQRWRALADDDVIWHNMCKQHIRKRCTKCGWGLPLLEQERLMREARYMELRAAGRGLNPPSAPSPGDSGVDALSSRESSAAPSELTVHHANKRSRSMGLSSPKAPTKRARTQDDGGYSYFQPRKRPWKEVYKDRFIVGTNWKHGRCSMKVLKGHQNGVMCLQFDDRYLATGSYDTTIKIWDVHTGEELRTLRGHDQGIRCLQFDQRHLLSGSIDRTIKVWNWREGTCLFTMPTLHTGGIICLDGKENILASGSMDKNICIVTMARGDKPKAQPFLLNGHTDWVNSVKIDLQSRTIFSASDDLTVKLWDLNSRQCIRTFEGHLGQVQQVLLLPPEFELDDDMDYEHAHSNSEDDLESHTSEVPRHNRHNAHNAYLDPSSPASPIEFWDYELEPDRPLPPRHMLTSALDGTIRLWDVHTGRCVKIFFGHVQGVWALAADTLRIVSGSEDRMVKVWDPRTGKCERTFTGHEGPVTCVGLSDSMMVTGSEDCEVRVYCFGQDADLPSSHAGCEASSS